jgi:hypothetical protein
MKSHVDFSFGTNDVIDGHQDTKKTVQQIEQQEKGWSICKVGHGNLHLLEVEQQGWLQINKGRLQGKNLNLVSDRFKIFEKKRTHSFCLSLSPLNTVAYAKDFKWYAPPLVMDKENNMQMLSQAGCMEIENVRMLYPHLLAE